MLLTSVVLNHISFDPFKKTLILIINLIEIFNNFMFQDMAAQADEVDGRYLHFENDMQVTSTFLTAVFAISETSKQAPLISAVSSNSCLFIY